MDLIVDEMSLDPDSSVVEATVRYDGRVYTPRIATKGSTPLNGDLLELAEVTLAARVLIGLMKDFANGKSVALPIIIPDDELHRRAAWVWANCRTDIRPLEAGED